MGYIVIYDLDNGDWFPVHKLVAALIFQLAFYMVFLTDTMIAALRPIGKRLRPTWDDAMRAVLTPIIFFGAVFIMSTDAPFVSERGSIIFEYIHPIQDYIYDWLGIFAFIGAAWYALLAVGYSRHIKHSPPAEGWHFAQQNDGVVSHAKETTPPLRGTPPKEGNVYWHSAPSAAVVIALGFVAIGIPLQFSAMWITLGWLTVFAGLWYFGNQHSGHRQNDKTFLVMSVIFFGLGMVRFVQEIAGQLSEARTLLDIPPVFNTIALPMLACAGVMIVAAVLARRYVRPLALGERVRVRGKTSEGTNSPHPSPLPEGEGTGIASWQCNHFFGILGYVLLGIILSGEAARYIYATPEFLQWLFPGSICVNPSGDDLPLCTPEYLFPAFLLGFWFLLAVVLLQVGFVCRSKVIASVAFCGLALSVMAMLFVGFPARCHYFMEAFNNPYCIVLIAQSIILLLIGFQSQFVNCHSREGGNPDGGLCSLDPRLRGGDGYQNVFGAFGIIGLFTLLAILTIEWFNYWDFARNGVPVLRSITLFWSLYAMFWIAVGFAARSLPIRICGMIVLFGALIKTTFLDSQATFGFCSWEWGAGYSLEDWTLLANPYFMTMLCPVLPALFLAVWTHQSRILATFVGNQERVAWKTSGIIGLVALLIYLSVECYQYFDAVQWKYFTEHASFLGATVLTVFWTVAALILTTLALCFKSKTLRIISMSILWVAVMNVLMGLDYRPGFTTPFLNLYFIPTLVLAGALLTLGCLWIYRLPENSMERKIYRFLAFVAVIFLWFTMSVECYRAVQLLLRENDPDAWRAQMALSVLWSLFAGVLITIGFIGRSATLRWMAILLFTATLTKILIVDMSGVNYLYRFGAIFALASLLALAALAYQRFKPEGTEKS